MKRFVKVLLGAVIGAGVATVAIVKIKNKIDYSKCRTADDYEKWENRHTERKEKVASKFKDAVNWCAKNEQTVKSMTLAVEFGSAVLLGVSRAKKVKEASKVSKQVDDISKFITKEWEDSVYRGEQHIIKKLKKGAQRGYTVNLWDNVSKQMLHFNVQAV